MGIESFPQKQQLLSRLLHLILGINALFFGRRRVAHYGERIFVTTLVAYSNYRTESGITVSEIGKHIRQREIGGKWAFFLTNPDLSELLASAPGENLVILR
ncbi:MAG TPA: hypothetical protein PL064_12155, partial [Thermogutta sp.]|nr:hypothetical protein [Thermogutta sp.]